MQSKQSQVWLLAALAAPIAHFSGCGWLTVLITAALVLPLARINKDWIFPKPIALFQILWLGIVAGSLLHGTAECWPSDNSLAVPLTLLTLAALTGAAKAPRIGAVLAFAMGLLALPVALSGAAHLKPQWLSPTPFAWNPMLVLVLLLTSLPVAGKGKGLELNTSGLDRCGGFLPTPDYFRRFKELGGEIVTVGSDAHRSDRVGQYSKEACQVLKEIFGYVCTFEGRKPVFHKL